MSLSQALNQFAQNLGRYLDTQGTASQGHSTLGSAQWNRSS